MLHLRHIRQRGRRIADLPQGFHAKIARAKEHLDALKVAIAPYVGDGEAYSVSKEVDREKGEFVFRLHISHPATLIEWSTVIGDCFHNTRTALDHLYWALAVKRNPGGNIKNKSSVNFPIIKDATTFNGRKFKIENLVGKEALAMLEGIQPFNDARGWNKNPLMFLHDFNNIDKHQLLLPSVSILNKGRFSHEVVDGKEVKFNAEISMMEIDDGAVIARCLATPPEDIVDLNYRVAFDVVFRGQPGPLLVVPSLERVIEVVEGVGADFAPLL